MFREAWSHRLQRFRRRIFSRLLIVAWIAFPLCGCGRAVSVESADATLPETRPFQAEVWLRIDFGSGDQAIAGTRLSQFAANQLELIRSPAVMREVLDEGDISKAPGLADAEEPVRWLLARTSVRRQGESELFVLAFGGPSRSAATRIVNSIAEKYLQLHSRLESERLDQQLRALRGQREQLRSAVLRLEQQLGQSRSATGPDAASRAVPLNVRLTQQDLEARRAQLFQVTDRILQLEMKQLEPARVRLISLAESPENGSDK